MDLTNLTEQDLNDIWQKLSPKGIEDLLEYLKKHVPEQYEALARSLQANRGAILEAQGYEKWLRTLGPHTFTGTFSFFHHEFWQWYWPLVWKFRRGEPIDLSDLVMLIPWSRDSGKSSHSEWAAIAEGAIVRSGYVLWVSGRQSQAEEHVTSIRERIEGEHIGKVYPWLGKPKVGTHGNKFGWARDFLLTAGGWAIRPVGLDVALRGGKVLDMRPTLIVISDVDEIGDSPAVVENKERVLTRSILPMGSAQTRIIFDQNPIHSNSVNNRILTRVSSALAVRRVTGGGPIPAFNNLKIEIQQTDQGPRNVIIGGTPTWPDMSMEKCQTFLDRSGLDAFMAEYQHDVSATDEERVLPEYDDRILRLHVITWSQFEAKYNQRRIPADWPCDCGLDIGYTTGHKSAWTFLTKPPQGYSLAGSIFRYRGRTYTSVIIDDMALAVRRDMWPDEQIEREYMSHEKKGERMVLNTKHGWHFHPCDSAKTAGLAEWRHYLKSDRSQPHPFHRDEKGLDGLWKLGRPAWFDIVDDDQFIAPRDDRGLRLHRDQAYNWRMRPVKLTDSGLTVEQPMKADEDTNDSTRALLANGSFGPADQPMTNSQKVHAMIPQGYHREELLKRADLDPAQRQMTAEVAQWQANRRLGLLRPREKDEFGNELR